MYTMRCDGWCDFAHRGVMEKKCGGKSGKEIKEDKKGSRELVLSVGCDVYVLTKAECII